MLALPPSRAAWLTVFCSLCLAGLPSGRAAVGDARIAKWKDDRQAVFLLMFDDGWPGQLLVAIPELQKRNLTATFYMVPDKGEYKVLAPKWAEAIKAGGVVYGNHTMTHHGVHDAEHARTEVGHCSDVIRELQPGKPGRLISFAQPGVPKGKWNINATELDQVLVDTNTISRPPFRDHGAVYHWKTLPEMTALIDDAVTRGDMNYLILHGVERLDSKNQDFWPLAQSIFLPLLDELKTRQDSGALWVTDHISYVQYQAERSAATLTVTDVMPKGIRLNLKSSLDPALYDLPLTVVLEVPAAWRDCHVKQGERQWTVRTADGRALIDALPDGTPVSIWPAN